MQAAISRILISAMVVLCPTPGFAETKTDARQQVDALLASYGKVPVTTVKYRRLRLPPWGSIRVPEQHTKMRLLTAGAISIRAEGEPDLGTPVISSFPQDMIGSTQESINCSSAPGAANVSLQVSGTRSSSVTFQRTVTNTIGGSFGLSFPVGGMLGSASISVQRSSASGTARTQGMSDTFTATGSGTITLAPRSRILATLTSYRVSTTTRFSIAVLADADLSANDRHLNRLSAIFPAEQRRLTISGSIQSNDFSAGRLTFSELPFDERLCPAGAMVVTRLNAPVDPALPTREIPVSGLRLETQ